MFFINHYVKDTSGKITKAVYERETLYDAKAEFYRRQSQAMAAADTVWTLCVIMDENGAVYMTDKSVKPVEPEVPEE